MHCSSSSGVFNAFIFFYHKIHDIRNFNVDEEDEEGNKISICVALFYILCRPMHTNEIQFTRMSKVENERIEDKANRDEDKYAPRNRLENSNIILMRKKTNLTLLL